MLAGLQSHQSPRAMRAPSGSSRNFLCVCSITIHCCIIQNFGTTYTLINDLGGWARLEARRRDQSVHRFLVTSAAHHLPGLYDAVHARLECIASTAPLSSGAACGPYVSA